MIAGGTIVREKDEPVTVSGVGRMELGCVGIARSVACEYGSDSAGRSTERSRLLPFATAAP